MLKAINPGWRGDGKTIVYREDWRKEEVGMTGYEKTESVLKDIMNSILPNMEFTTETCNDFESNTLPTLDTQLWIRNGKVNYSYYEKPTTNKQVLNKKSAMSENGKIASLSQELIRRLKNTDLSLPQNNKDDIINMYCRKMVTSGYTRSQIHRIITAGLRGFDKMVLRQAKGLCEIHRPAAKGAATRNRKKLLGKSRWFKPRRQEEGDDGEKCPERMSGGNSWQSGGNGCGKTSKEQTRQVDHLKVTTVLFVEQTPGGELAKRFRQAEFSLSGITGFKVKIVEKTGTAIKSILHNSNPWAEGFCSRSDCYPCQTGEVKSCYMRNLVYSNQCLDCKEKGKVSIYLGETSRSAYERGGDHIDDYRRKKEDSHILKHQMTEHSHSAPNYQFRILARFQSALMRQVTEAVLIRRQEEGTVLNSKGVFNRCSLPRLTVEGAGMKEDRKEEGGGLEQEFDKEEEIAGNVTFQKKRFRPPNERAFKPRKRIKIDKKTTKEDNPRLEGLCKRKWPVLEFENECKRIRPNFSPELELEFGNKTAEAETVQTSKKMFSIFSKPKDLKNLPTLIQKCEKNVAIIPKVKKKSTSIKKGSLTTNASKPGDDIRKYFN